jgi:hypothetical protein
MIGDPTQSAAHNIAGKVSQHALGIRPDRSQWRRSRELLQPISAAC